jgi:hypothetical protein
VRAAMMITQGPYGHVGAVAHAHAVCLAIWLAVKFTVSDCLRSDDPISAGRPSLKSRFRFLSPEFLLFSHDCSRLSTFFLTKKIATAA